MLMSVCLCSCDENNIAILFSLSKANNDILAFLSGMPVTRNTRYLDLKNSVSFNPCDKWVKSRWFYLYAKSHEQWTGS